MLKIMVMFGDKKAQDSLSDMNVRALRLCAATSGWRRIGNQNISCEYIRQTTLVEPGI